MNVCVRRVTTQTRRIFRITLSGRKLAYLQYPWPNLHCLLLFGASVQFRWVLSALGEGLLLWVEAIKRKPQPSLMFVVDFSRRVELYSSWNDRASHPVGHLWELCYVPP